MYHAYSSGQLDNSDPISDQHAVTGLITCALGRSKTDNLVRVSVEVPVGEEREEVEKEGILDREVLDFKDNLVALLEVRVFYRVSRLLLFFFRMNTRKEGMMKKEWRKKKDWSWKMKKKD